VAAAAFGDIPDMMATKLSAAHLVRQPNAQEGVVNGSAAGGSEGVAGPSELVAHRVAVVQEQTRQILERKQAVLAVFGALQALLES